VGIPEFVVELRRHIGTSPLPLVGATAVILDGAGDAERVLLGRRTDNGALTPISGVVDPGEEPAAAVVREALEEAGVHIRVTRLAWVHQLPRITYGNGDQVDYLDLTFRCDWLSGTPAPADGELVEVGWYPTNELRGLRSDHRRRVELALPEHGETVFERPHSPAGRTAP
jgi:8-oxo-dGTP pyrophosphatase MutT (NUDIX family)